MPKPKLRTKEDPNVTAEGTSRKSALPKKPEQILQPKLAKDNKLLTGPALEH